LLGRDRPDEAGQLAGAGDDGLLLELAAGGHSEPAAVEAILAAPGALDHERILAALAAGELVADLRPAAGVPGRFDEQAAHVAVADLRDRALPALLAGGVLGGHEADEGRELLGASEAGEVADLGRDPERAQRVDPAQAAQPGDERTPGLLLGRLADGRLERIDPPVDEVDRVPVGIEGLLLGGELEALLAQPLGANMFQD
jgi:hypothetical protein